MGRKQAENKRVAIIHTGGTFGMGAGTDLKARLLERVPEMSNLAHCEVTVHDHRDSCQFQPQDWIALAQAVRAQLKTSRVDGVVILHGTDTLSHSAAALSFLLRDLKVPVVMTGSMRPLAAIRTDARRNLIAAIEIAAQGKSRGIQGVHVFFNDKLFLGTSIRKRSAQDFDAFESPKVAAIAEVGTEINYLKPSRKQGLRQSSKMADRFSGSVLMVHLAPGFPAALIQKQLPLLDALVLIVYPSVTAPTDSHDFIALLKEARRLSVPIIAATEAHAPHGVVTDEGIRYAATQELLKNGVLSAGQMTPECALIKVMWLMGQPKKAGRKSLADFLRHWKMQWANEGVSR